MKAKKNMPNLIFFKNYNDYTISTNHPINDKIYIEDNSNNYPTTKGNIIKDLSKIGTSYLSSNKREYFKEKANLKKDINKNNYFNFPLTNNFNTLNYTYNGENDINENKMFLRQKKRKKMLLKNDMENKEKNIPGKIKVNSERRAKIKTRKIKGQKKDDKMKKNEGLIDNTSKEIFDKRIKKNSNKKKKQTSDNNNGVYFYSGINNYIIKENFQNNVLNPQPKINKKPIQINSYSSFKTIENNFNNSNISLNNKLKNKSINFQKIYPKNNFQSLNNLILKNKKAKKTENRIYKKKVTNNSLSLSRKHKKSINNTFNTNPNIELSSSINNLDFAYFGMTQNKMEKYIQNSKYLNKGNENYFKIRNISIQIQKSNDNNSKSSLGNNKVYQKPNRLKKNLTYIQNSFKGLDLSKNGYKISPERMSLNSKRGDNEINEKKISFDFMKNNTKPCIEENDKYTKKKFLLFSRQTKELDKLVFSKSIEEPSKIGPRISIHKNKEQYNIFQPIIKNYADKKYFINNNTIGSKDDIKFSIEETNNKRTIQNNGNNTIQNYNHVLNLPISNYHFFTKENIKVYKEININLENESFTNYNISNKLLKNNILMNNKLKFKRAKIKVNKDNNNNYIPIKGNEGKNNIMNIPYVISKDMVDKLNEKIKKNKPVEIRNEIKLSKESYSYDTKKVINKNNGMNGIIGNEILFDKDAIEDAKNKRYKLRSVVKVIKKSKKNSYSQKKRTKEEENEIKEKLKINNEQTEQEQIKNLKIKIILKEDIENFILFYNKSNKQDSNNNNNIEEKKKNKYDWSIIEQLIIKAKVDLIDIINCFLEISQEVIDNKDKMKIWNEYLSKIIRHYNNRYLNEKNEKNIHIKMLKILGNIDNISINKKYKYEILGNLFYQFLIEEMFCEEDLNYFENEEQKLIIEIAKVIKIVIILLSDNKKIANEYHNKFKNTKLFYKNPIYFNYVSKYLKSTLNINNESISYNI